MKYAPKDKLKMGALGGNTMYYMRTKYQVVYKMSNFIYIK